jgi:hypothetical protein
VGLRPALYITKRCTRLAVASDKVYQLITHGRWFSPSTPTSSITKTDRHDIAEILLKLIYLMLLLIVAVFNLQLINKLNVNDETL